MNTIKIYLTTNGRVADLKKDFPLFQYQFQNKLLNIFVPTSILAPHFTSESEDGVVLADYIASTSVKIGMTYTARDGTIKVSKNYYMRYLKTLTYQNVEYALYERKMPQEFTFYEGQGENAPVLVMNVVNILQETESGNPEIIQITTSQNCSLDVMPSTDLDNDEPIEASELENINAQLNEINGILPLKQNIFDEGLLTTNKTVVGAINEISQSLVLGETYVGQITGNSLPSDEELSQFVQTRLNRQPKNGDVVIFVLKVENATDRNYKYIFSSGDWSNYEIPPIEEAGNGSLGIVQGTWAIGDTANTLVDISGGKILNIYIKDNDGVYRNLVEYANSLKNGLVEERAFVKDYSMPREFNDVYFISSQGYVDKVPTTPASGIQFTTNTNSVGDFQLFQIEKPNNADFELSAKNGYSNNIYVSSSIDANVTFRLTTQYRIAGQNWADLNIELSNPISLVAGEIQKITFSNPFTYLGEEVISLTEGDYLRQILEVVTQTSDETTFNVYSNDVYPSIFNLTSQSYVLSDIEKGFSTLIHLGIDGVIEDGQVKFEVQNADSYLEYKTNNREFVVSAVLPLVGEIDNSYPVSIKFGDIVYNVYSYLKGLANPITIGDLRSNLVYNNNIGYFFTLKMMFLETSDYQGFVISPATITADQLLNIIEDTDTIVSSIDSTGSKITLQLSAAKLNRLMRALVTPTNAPSGFEIVAVNSGNSQVMLELGDGLYVADGKLNATGGGETGGTTNYDDLDNKPILNTNNATSQNPNSNETMVGTINLHKVSKTGALADTIQDSAHRTVTDTEKSTWNNPQFSSIQNVPQASTGVSGIVQLATDQEAETGTNQTKAVTPKQLKTAVDGIGSVFTLKGSVANVAALPSTGNEIGDVYYVISENVGYIWLNDGTTDRWEQLGLPIDLSSYVQFSDIINALNSNASDKPLSALQGKVLNDMITSLMAELGETQQDVADNMTDIANLKTFDLVIKNQTQFQTMLASPNWLGAKSVAFVGDGGTLQFTASDTITIPQTVMQIQGFNNATIKITPSTSYNGLLYSTKPTGAGYSFKDIKIVIPNYNGYAYSVRNMVNLTNVTLEVTEGSITYERSGFFNCDNLINCKSTCPTFAFFQCSYLVNCIGTSFRGGEMGYGFYDCSYGINSVGTTGGTMTLWFNKEQSGLPIGSIIQSTCVQHSAGLHLADGSELAIGGSYDAFCQYVINNQADFEITDLATYQSELTEYGQCGKYVITSTYVKLPKITKMIESANSREELGQSVKAGLPNITGGGQSVAYKTINYDGAFEADRAGSVGTGNTSFDNNWYNWGFNASRSNPIYGNSDTVQPQTTKYYFYIVVATVTKTDIEVNIDNIATDLNNKTDKDATNLSDTNVVNWRNKLGVSNFGEYDNLWNGNTNGTYTIPNILNYKMLLAIVKMDDANWFSSYIPVKFLMQEFEGGYTPNWNINGNNPDTYMYFIFTFNSTTNIGVSKNKTQYAYLYGIK